ncbi:hypothetical protein AJ79_07321 [Helicocarpus griseus UAMH5409]|uniref:ubiquitinyl hydrolase 1 n=1 Tax=Helicocarpus griseus UAMH5409 TaxID=1447875 RepID=A0A2B7X415_9EURO|nr:hypothetical protein AJ79_07321 [Helicocarpus griseus UAMH5409]
MLAVPYRAKDSPAPRASFSHPNATIVLTCLSYYYSGLSNEHLEIAFKKLFLGDHAQEEYQVWVDDAPTLPTIFHNVTSVNLQNTDQCKHHLFPHLRFSKGAIDYFLAQIVFPKEMREYEEKISCSGWNIGRKKNYPTTGFSGTNDSRYILPLSVQQCSSKKQLHTNAKQLLCVLGSENTFSPGYSSDSEEFNSETLLQKVTSSTTPIQVILDVGAQVLELQNEQLAKLWLSKTSTPLVEAVIFFDDNDELTVLTRDGNKEALYFSPYALSMEKCLVYLDEAHTRGTDLVLPTNYRAAVTLGPNVTKDRLVQACMRMRKLGKGQSLVFYAPADIQRKIRQCNDKTQSDAIQVSDVLRWAISETWGTPENALHPLSSDSLEFPLEIAKSIVEKEAQSIEERYGFYKACRDEQVILRGVKDKTLTERMEEINAIRAKCKYFNTNSFDTSQLQEEQERELQTELEREQQVEQPLELKPAEHVVHSDAETFFSCGLLNQSSPAFVPAFDVFKRTSLAGELQEIPWTRDLLVTRDFIQTVADDAGPLLDLFMRPVNWIATPD